MHNRSPLRCSALRIFSAILLTLSVATFETTGQFVEDRDNAAATRAGFAHNLTAAEVGALKQKGFRVTNLVPSLWNPQGTRVTVAYVPNSGDFYRKWWYAIDYTANQLTAFINLTKSRITNLEAYPLNGQVRFAALLEANNGTNIKSWSWYFNQTSLTQLIVNAANSSSRIIDLERYQVGTTKYFAAVMIKNSGIDNKSSLYQLDLSPAQIHTNLTAYKGRIWDLDRAGPNKYDVVMVKRTGEDSWYYYNQTEQQVREKMAKHGGRLIDVQPFVGGNPLGWRFDIVLANCLSPLAARVRDQMAWQSDGRMGAHLRQIQPSGRFTDLAFFNADAPFEPAAALARLHHAFAVKSWSMSTPVTVNTMTTSVISCPSPTTAYSLPLSTVLEGMMQKGNNAYTRAITDKASMSVLNGAANSYGMSDTQLNHHIGCWSPANVTTLVDLGRIDEKVVSQANFMTPNQEYHYYKMFEQRFYGPGAVYASSRLTSVIDDEAAKVGLSASQRAEFVKRMRVYGTTGAYFVGGAYHRCWSAYVTIPAWANGGIQQQRYVTGTFVNGASSSNKANQAAGIGAAELLRDAIRAGMETLKTYTFGSFDSFGTSCDNAWFQKAQGSPELGKFTTFRVDNPQIPNFLTTFYVGTSNTSWNSAPLPLELGFLGAPNCFLRVAPLYQIWASASNNSVKIEPKIPVDKSLIGQVVYTQFAVWDKSANAAGLVATNGVKVTIGGQK